MEKAILNKCEIVHPNAAELSPEEFTQIRRQGLGASDAAAYLGLTPQWNTAESVIMSKLLKGVSDEEREVGAKISVRMGHYLEPLILDLYSKEMEKQVIKPSAMYRLKEHPFLTINYDGIAQSIAQLVYPVEAKFATFYGDKYWNWKLAFDKDTAAVVQCNATRSTIFDHCEQAAAQYGIPIYYYPQIQQEMMGLDSPYGDFAVIRAKDTKFYTFRVFADPWLQSQIIIEGYKVDQKIQRRKLQS